MRWTRRRNEATERARSSSDSNAVVSVRRPRCFSWPALVRSGFGGTTGRTGMPTGRRMAPAGWAAAGAPAGRAEGAEVVCGRSCCWAGASSPRRFFASVSALRRASSSTVRRASSSRLRASAASRSVARRASSAARRRASSSARWRSSASRERASASARPRAPSSSFVKVRSTTPGLRGAGAGRCGAAGAAATGAAGA